MARIMAGGTRKPMKRMAVRSKVATKVAARQPAPMKRMAVRSASANAGKMIQKVRGSTVRSNAAYKATKAISASRASRAKAPQGINLNPFDRNNVFSVAGRRIASGMQPGQGTRAVRSIERIPGNIGHWVSSALTDKVIGAPGEKIRKVLP
jgi:hypothetical protein